MKKGLVFVSLLVGLFVMSFIVFGCGTSTSTTTTTTATVAPAPGATAKASVLMASGGASIGVAATGIGGSASTSPKASSITSHWGLRAMMGNPPPAFFTKDLTGSTDGYFNPLSTPPLGGKMTPYIRLRTATGEVITGAFFTGKKIAKFPGCSVEAIFAGGPDKAPDGIVAGVGSFCSTWASKTTNGTHPELGFADSTLFAPITTMGDYLCWAYIYCTMESEMTTKSYGGHPWPNNAQITTPEAGDEDKIGSMDSKMVFTDLITGEIKVSMDCHSDGRVKVGDYDGTGKLTTPIATMDVTSIMTFTKAGDPPSLVTMVGTNETSPLYTTKIYITSPSTGVGTGEIWDYSVSPVVQIGTIVTSATGGSVTVGGTTETFTF